MSIIDKIKSVKNKRVARKLKVKSATNLTANMRRVTLQGDALKSFPAESEGAYIKLLFDQGNGNKPIMRTYTVAQQRSTDNEIDVDFMLHNNDDGSDHGIEQNDWQEGKVAAWVACEFVTMKKIRHYLKVDKGVEKSHLYISSYWKKGNTEEQHKVIKQKDAG